MNPPIETKNPLSPVCTTINYFWQRASQVKKQEDVSACAERIIKTLADKVAYFNAGDLPCLEALKRSEIKGLTRDKQKAVLKSIECVVSMIIQMPATGVSIVPVDILRLFFAYLPKHDCFNLCRVNRRFHAFYIDPKILAQFINRNEINFRSGLEKCSQFITTLDLPGIRVVSDMGKIDTYLNILSCCTNLQSLRLSSTENIEAHVLPSLSSYKELREISIVDYTTVDPVLRLINKHCTQLTSINLESNWDNLSSSTCLNLPDIDKIKSINFWYGNDANVSTLTNQCTNLRKIHLADGEISNETLRTLGVCSELTYIILERTRNLEDDGLRAIILGCTKVSRLDLWGCPKLTDEGMGLLHLSTRLRILNIQWCSQLTDTGAQKIALCSSLETLNLDMCERITNRGVIAIAAGCTRLKELGLHMSSLNDFSTNHLRTDEGVKAIGNHCHALVKVDLGWWNVTSAGITALAKGCMNLKDVILKGCTKVDDDCVQALSDNCRDLEYAFLYKCEKMTDKSLAILAQLPELRDLNVQYCPHLTDKGLKKLEDSPKLNYIDVVGCKKLTKNGIQSFQSKKPDIKHDKH